jgi:SAM-dependent methyltransferase
MSHLKEKRRAIAQHSAQADEFADRYARLETSPYANCFAYSRLRLDAWLERMLPARGDGLRLLDVGCGTGHHLARLRAHGFEVAGVDGSPEMIAHARENNPGARIERADVESIPFATGSFDLVVCVEVLRYLPDVRGCLAEIARVLKPGGVCLATAAPRWNLNGYWLVNRLASSLGLPGLVTLRQYFETSRSLRQACESAGFSRPEIHGVYLGPVNWVERLVPRMLPAVLRAWESVDVRLADRPLLRELSNMFLVRAVRRG